MSDWIQKNVPLTAKARGFHIISNEVLAALPELQQFRVGLLHLFIQHTSASLSLNENVDPDVRTDFESHMNHMVPENAPYYTHTLEGSDDMPAHIKASLLGSSLSIPICQGQLAMGTWQGIYLCEHRNQGGARTIVATLFGES